MTVRRNRAFAAITALALVGIVGVTLATLTAVFARDVKRSLRQQDEAQLRQLLIAGEIAARESLGQPGAGETAVTVPQELASAGISLTWERLGEIKNEGVEVRVIARVGDGRSLSQSLRYVKTEKGWQLQDATAQ
jgi:hypothetical protein